MPHEPQVAESEIACGIAGLGVVADRDVEAARDGGVEEVAA